MTFYVFLRGCTRFLEHCALMVTVTDALHGAAGPFQQLNAEAIEQELGDMSRALYKLSKAFSEQPAPRNVADRVRRQMEKFKSYQALLNVICNPGIRERHWKKVNQLNVYCIE